MLLKIALFMVLFLNLFSTAHAQSTDSCSGVQHIEINNDPSLYRVSLARLNTALRNVRYDTNGLAKVCFRILNGPFEMEPSDLPIRITPSSMGSEMIVHGFEIITKTGRPLDDYAGKTWLTVDSPIKVTIINPKITNATHGIVLRGTGQHEVIGTNNVGDIACAANSSGNGILIQSPGAKIKGMNVHGCGEGIRITANDALIGAETAERYEADKNTIHGNGVGLHVVSGERNKFAFNSVFENPAGSSMWNPDDNLLMENLLIAAMGRPEVQFTNAQTGEALRCEKDNTGKILTRTLLFNVPTSGLMVITTDKSPRNIWRGKDFVSTCQVDQSGRCDFVFPAFIPVNDTQCGVPLYAIAQFLTDTYSTAYTTQSFLLSGVATIQTVALPLPVQTTSGADGSQQSTDLTNSSPTLDPGLQFRDTGAGGTTGVSAGCGATLVPHEVNISPLIAFFTSLGILVFVRKRK